MKGKRNIKYLETHLGEMSFNKNGTPIKIIRYVNTSDLTIEFQDEYKVQKNITYQNFKRGQIKNPYDPLMTKRGYLGEGKYQAKPNGKNTKEYSIWGALFKRCYCNESQRYRYPAYEGCSVCKEWHNFQLFAKWYEDSWYQVDDERMHIDKDILIKGNKIYSPDTCLLVPQRINMLFQTKARKDDLPTGVWKNINGKYVSSYNGNHIGVFETVAEAADAHDFEMRIHIRGVAEEYKDKIPKKLYDALIEY
jgi:hypothetical protein